MKYINNWSFMMFLLFARVSEMAEDLDTGRVFNESRPIGQSYCYQKYNGSFLAIYSTHQKAKTFLTPHKDQRLFGFFCLP